MGKVGLEFVGKGMSERFRRMAKQLPQEVNDELRLVAEDMVPDFEKTTATWKTRVTFAVAKTEKGYTVSTASDIWNWVDRGVRKHTIRPVNAPRLVFQTGYKAKTAPTTISSREGGRSGPITTALKVKHPGIAARKFTTTIVGRWQPKVTGRVRKRLDRGIEALGL